MGEFKILAAFVVLFSWAESRQLPSYIKPCKQTDEDVSKCTADVMNSIRSQLGDGIKELGVPPMKNLEVSELAFVLNGGNSNISIVFKDLIFKGGEQFQIQSTNVDPAKGIFELKLMVPAFQCTSKYQMRGKLVLIDLAASGDMALNFTNVVIDAKYVAMPFQKNDQEHYKFNPKSFDVDIESFTTHFDNLINGNAEITETVNHAFNENADLMLQQIHPGVSEAVQQLVTSVLNRVFDRFSVEELYPKN